MVDFKGAHYPKSVILFAVFFYLRYPVSYRDLEEIMQERGVDVDHATMNHWVVKYSPLIAAQAQTKKRPTAKSWRMDETYIKVKGKWMYHYRAVDRNGQTLDFMLSERRDKPAARRFFRRAIGKKRCPRPHRYRQKRRKPGWLGSRECYPQIHRNRSDDQNPAG